MKLLKKTVLIVFCLLPYCIATPLDDLLHTHIKQNRDEGIQDLVHKIEKKETSPTQKGEALLKLGLMYLYGNESVPSNTTLSMKILNESSQFGNSHAQHIMAVGYSSGLWGLPRNEAKAILYYYFASLGGDVGATMALGYRYLHGLGVTESCETAILYYEIAANIAIQLRNSEPVPPIIYDRRPARLSSYVEGSRSTPKDSEVVDYYHYSADKGDGDAMQSLGSVYYYGARGVKQDLEKASKYFKLAAKHGSYAAQANLGHIYLHGLGVTPNDDIAFRYFYQAVLTGNAAGQNGLGYMYLHGRGTDQDVNKALELFTKAAKQGNADALYNLGVVNMGINGQEPDFHRALQHFHVAAQHSHTLALHKLAKMHAYGLATTRSCASACEYFKGVAERGPWSIDLAKASKGVQEGNNYFSFVTYAIKAEEGFEAAQSNAAWMIENGLGYNGINHGEVCINFYKLAAVQGNVEANLKIGDLNYYGRGGIAVNYGKATAHYRQASKSNNAQAMFNLGIMQEHGIGLPQDLLLAKRWYDLAAEARPEAYAPVALALIKLRLHIYLQNLYNKYIIHYGEESMFNGLATDTIAIIILMIILIGLLGWRKLTNIQ